MESESFAYYEFFSGGGMARAGLGEKWRCLFANDFDHKKCAAYRANWGDDELVAEDIRNLSIADIPTGGDLAWASFPCQDLSLAGGGAGLQGKRSGTFWPFWRLMRKLDNDGRAPGVVVLENVAGALSSHGGQDFEAICSALRRTAYNFGAVIMDAALFTPQSRPRLFIIAVHDKMNISPMAIGDPNPLWHPRTIMRAYNQLSSENQKAWIWWRIAAPPRREKKLSDIIDDFPEDAAWHDQRQTKKLLDMMSDVNLAKIHAAKRANRPIVGAIYKRTRRDKVGVKIQRAEVRFDGLAGCLRTPSGGSSRQTIIVVHGNQIKSRLISSRETARLMGLPESYVLPEKYNDAYHLTGDGVVVPVVKHLATHILEPIVENAQWRQGMSVAA